MEPVEPVEHTAQRTTHGPVIQRSTSDERRAGLGDSGQPAIHVLRPIQSAEKRGPPTAYSSGARPSTTARA